MRSTRVLNRYRRLKSHYHAPEVAAQYDSNLFRNERFHRVNEQQLAALGRLLDQAAAAGHPARRILDLPCGTGRLFPELARRGEEVVGCDIAIPMLSEAERKARFLGPAVFTLLAGNAERLPFDDDSFDAVVSCRFLRHAPRSLRVSLMREMARVTRGWLVVDPRAPWHPRYVREFTRGVLSIPWRLPNYGLTRRALAGELAEAGFRLERIEFLAPGSPAYMALARRV